MKKFNVQTLAAIAFLVALHIILSRFLSVNAWNIKIGFAFTAIFIAAYIFGPVAAMITGALGDILGAVLYPIGPYFPGFTLTCALTGLLYGILLHKKQSIARIITASLINNLILSLLLNSYWIAILYGTQFKALLVTRSIQVAILIPVEIITMKLLLEIMKKINIKKLAGVNKSSDLMEKRKALRKEKISKRNSLSEDEREEKSKRICERIKASDEFNKAENILIYSPVKAEVDISYLLDEEKTFAYPVILPDKKMKAVIPEGDWTKSSYGIPEPDKGSGKEILPEEINLVIAPCAAFDEKCGRLGMGGGYYDRFLVKCINSKVIAAAFECQKADDVYMMSWDRYCDYVFTEENGYVNLKI